MWASAFSVSIVVVEITAIVIIVTMVVEVVVVVVVVVLIAVVAGANVKYLEESFTAYLIADGYFDLIKSAMRQGC